ncbi:Uncharacterised protein [Staphylococcus aureus]|nr:Uncharacterised protein [Staphylococcus aureus]CPL75956.1 Uncharacterised protein [Staphylococcus aureus]
MAFNTAATRAIGPPQGTMFIIAALNANSKINKYLFIFNALYKGNNAGIESKNVTAPAPSNWAIVPIKAVIAQTMTTLPRVINIKRLTSGLNKPLSFMMPKKIMAKINIITTLMT